MKLDIINKLIAILLFAFTFFLSPFTLLYAQGSIAYIENFNNNSNGWFVQDNPGMKGVIKDNRYYLEQKEEDTMSMSWQKIPVGQNSDFQAETSVKFLGGAHNFGYGILWGYREGSDAAFYSHMISPSGQHCLMKYGNSQLSYILPWTESPTVNKGQSINILTIKKSGNMMSFFVNNQQIGSRPVETFFGDKIGVIVGGLMAVEFHHFAITIPSVNVPGDLNAYIEGNFNSRFFWANPLNEKNFKALIHFGSKMSVARSFTSDEVNVSVTARSPRNVSDSTCGIYLQNDQGAIFKLERINTPKGLVARFTVTMGGVDKGVKEVIIPDRDVSFRISRQKDAFLGEVSIDGKTQKVGSLKWPNLSPKHAAGVIINYSDANPNIRGVWNYEFSNFLISTSTQPATFQTSMRQPVPQKLDGHRGQPTTVNVAGTSWSCKDDDGQAHDLIFDRKENFERPYHGSFVGAGTWKQSGNSVYLNVYNGAVEHWATIGGLNMQGKGRTSQGIEWTWLCSKKN